MIQKKHMKRPRVTDYVTFTQKLYLMQHVEHISCDRVTDKNGKANV